jgi:hypothetical protein
MDNHLSLKLHTYLTDGAVTRQAINVTTPALFLFPKQLDSKSQSLRIVPSHLEIAPLDGFTISTKKAT